MQTQWRLLSWCQEEVGGQHQAPAALLPRKDPIPTVLGAGCALQLVWKAWKSLSQPGFDLWTVQPVALKHKSSPVSERQNWSELRMICMIAGQWGKLTH